MGIENMGMDLDEQSKLNVTLPGQPGYRGAWDAEASKNGGQASREMVRDAAIEGAPIEELEGALGRLAEVKNPDADTLAALARVRARIDQIIQTNQH